MQQPLNISMYHYWRDHEHKKSDQSQVPVKNDLQTLIALKGLKMLRNQGENFTAASCR